MVLNEGVHELVEAADEAVNIHVARVAPDAVYWDVRAEVCLPVYGAMGWAVYLSWVANEKVPRSKMERYIVFAQGTVLRGGPRSRLGRECGDDHDRAP